MTPRKSVRGTNAVQIELCDPLRMNDLDNFNAVRAVLTSQIGLRHLQAEGALDEREELEAGRNALSSSAIPVLRHTLRTLKPRTTAPALASQT